MAEMDFTKVKLSKEQITNANLVADKAIEYGIDPDLALSVAWKESNFKMGSDSSKGAIGIMQVMPANAKGLDLKKEDLRDPLINVDAGMRILKENLDRYKNPRAALVAYNASPDTADKYVKANEDFDVLKPETKNYLEDIHTVYSLHPDDHPQDDGYYSKVEELPEHLKNKPLQSSISEAPKNDNIISNFYQQAKPFAKKIGKELGEFAVQDPSAAGFGSGLFLGELYRRMMNNATKAPPPPPPPPPAPTQKTVVGMAPENRANEQKMNWGTKNLWANANQAEKNLQNLQNRGVLSQGNPSTGFGPIDITEAGIHVREGSANLPPPKPASPLEGFIDRMTRKVTEGAPAIIKRFPRVTGALSGLLAGHELEQARKDLESNDPVSAILSGTQAGLGATSAIPLLPKQYRAGAMGLQIPVGMAKEAWQSYREPSAVKREIKKNPEMYKAKGGKVSLAIPLNLKHVFFHRKRRTG